nr:Chain A, DNAJB8 peptide AFSSFN [Homo sapiens]8DTS_B Chain B, DNAJB8 peptide AFSSFN [Homo sapiens]8DTS_C Chain C, DNAJB8 peptide AFSSFN [Homo sapiens]8DTS_D Chain D, DNAJB8 peptide AFSSFN [Homo sapiens]8DTS_E Chain E, DNAJB8 peptide AFSSFN [Homo sapiens]8DTS_F Chain F, DNAJB8 peptide AFSSFN [Homo sapiens]8DTS_G Chain G, DNAJB8 peptide AFSSFN [Homo sapiens]8DTS_H Chain H, DNAJB8 peptide AFSSFN [Homo sapiens]8DTS_I Chain I, DNAJB8 peptide AFSSFN [Homo sapiens]8DTS_J Chain J, DNAJB8 peptide
AFSSFN